MMQWVHYILLFEGNGASTALGSSLYERRMIMMMNQIIHFTFKASSSLGSCSGGSGGDGE
jgi:hypothetical protein